jgi:hypothetical protein
VELGFTIIFLIHRSFRGYNWFWIFLVGPHVGALLGVGVFHVFLKTELTDWATEYYVSSLKRSANKPPVLVAERSDEYGLRSQWRLQRSNVNLVDSMVSTKFMELESRSPGARRSSRSSQISTKWI